jgi:hypothetical protein
LGFEFCFARKTDLVARSAGDRGDLANTIQSAVVKVGDLKL